MEDNKQQKAPDLIDTTDCLEAIGAIRSMKNILFVVIMLCLIITGIVFWLDRAGRIDKTGCTCCSSCSQVSGVCSAVAAKTGNLVVDTPAAKEAVQSDVVEAASQITALAESLQEATDSVTASETTPAQTIEQPAAEPAADKPQTEAQPQQTAEEETLPKILRVRPSCYTVMMVVKACNFILVIAATMYCLMLLMSLKISLTGRLGGINHISRAFFISLFALVILLPWQVLLPGVVTGAIYQPKELLCEWSAKAKLSTFWLVMCYLRFVALWLVVVWLFVWSQMRAGKWSRATLRRLGLVR
ncbi:MAG: hypothetical protein ABFD91_11040 [Anaerohalosphaeraceae bacterium]